MGKPVEISPPYPPPGRPARRVTRFARGLALVQTRFASSERAKAATGRFPSTPKHRAHEPFSFVAEAPSFRTRGGRYVCGESRQIASYKGVSN